MFDCLGKTKHNRKKKEGAEKKKGRRRRRRKRGGRVYRSQLRVFNIYNMPFNFN